MGHSMGGGGSLEASLSRPSLQAAIPLTPWNTQKSFNSRVPTLIIGAESDSVASVRSHAEPFYESIPAATEKAYLELNNASHFAPKHLEHHDREVQHLLAEAVRGQRHPLRAVPVPGTPGRR